MAKLVDGSSGLASLAMLMDQPIVVPNLETRCDVGKHVEPMCGVYGRSVVIPLDMMRVADVVAVVEEMDTVLRHCV
jgi:hypothetical protein